MPPVMGSVRQRESLLPPLWVISLLLLILFFWLLIELKEIVFLLVLGYSLAYILDPCLDWFEKRGLNRSLGILVLLFVLSAFLLVVALTAVPTVVREYSRLSQELPRYLELAQSRLAPYLQGVQDLLPPGLQATEVLDLDKLPSWSQDLLKRVVGGISAALMSGYSLTLAALNLLLLPFIAYYLAVDFDNLHSRLLGLFPVLSRRKVQKIAGEIDRYVSAFVRGQLLVCSVLFVLYALGLGLLGVELWLLLALISGFGTIVPYLGFTLGVLLSSLMALVTFGDFSHVLQVWMIYAGVQLLESFLITPWIIGNRVGLSSLTVILAIVAGGSLFGILGIFLAVPGAAIVKVLLSHLGGWMIVDRS